MTPRQRDQLSRLQTQMGRLSFAVQQLQRAVRALDDLFELPAAEHAGFTDEEVGRLVRLNERLAFLERHLHHDEQRLYRDLSRRVADSNDPMDDVEIDVILHFMLREDDPAYDDDSDNILTERNFPLKGFTSDERLSMDWREHGRPFPGRLQTLRHCWLFHDLYDHSYGIKQPALGFHDCLRIDRIWVRVVVDHQATLDLETGNWEASAAQ